MAARSTRRLNRTIQITDTGINPGSGVGNHRNAINEETLGIPVIAVGIPTVVDAATIVNDTMEELIAQMDSSVSMQRLGGTLGTMNQAEKHQMIQELISPHLNTMFVTPKDIDETVKYLSYTISEGLNIALMNQAEKHQMIQELISPHLNTMFVTPKDIDETVKYLSYTISEGLNIALS